MLFITKRGIFYLINVHSEYKGGREMTDQELDNLLSDLTDSELYNFVQEHSKELTDTELDALVSELEGSPMDLREFVINALNL